MAFRSGRVTCSRFLALGDAPAVVHDTTLGILRDFRFRETEIGAPDEVEAGFVTGVHLLDAEFDHEKNGFGDALLFGLRIDTHRVPSDVKKAYEAIHRGAADAASPTGYASKAERREAAELAQRELRDNLAKGMYRRSKMVDVMWDLRRGQVFCGSASDSVLEQLARLMNEAFAVDMVPISAGALAGKWLRNTGRGRDYEDLQPTAFTPPPALARVDHEDAGPAQPIERPVVPWVAKAIDVKDWIGNEWLTWLWWVGESAEGLIDPGDRMLADEVSFTIDKALDMDCAWDATGKQTLRGDGPSRLPEAGEALREGKWPRKLGLLLSDGEFPFELIVQGDRYTINAAKLPDADEAQTPRDLIEHRLHVTRRLVDLIDATFKVYVELRTSAQWPAARSEMQRWVRERVAGPVAVSV
ncbi:MAG: hypothetical protein AAF823_00335 [Planctomycetota bacterium]